MKTASACIVVAALGLFGPRAMAAPLDITLSVPLFSDFSANPSVPDATLSGTLTYDDAAQTGSGTFTIGNYTNTFSGFALTDNSGTDLAVEFIGTDAADVASLFFNLELATGSVPAPGDQGVVMLSAPGMNLNYSTLPGALQTGGGAGTPGSSAPTGGMSPVPLPPAASLFGGGLLLLTAESLRRRLRLCAIAARRGAAA